MSFVFWDEQYSVGDEDLDRQHQHLFEMINFLGNEIAAGKGSEAVGAIIDEMIHYLLFHFASEEEKMEQCSYPGLAEHAEEHQDFVEQTQEFFKEYKGGVAGIDKKIWSFLASWLQRHVLDTDMRYLPFLAAKQG